MIEDQSVGKPLNCEEYYYQLHSKCGDVLASSFRADTNGLQSKAHQYVSDYGKWIIVLASRPEISVFKAGLCEYQLALLGLAQGQYRQSFMGLRLFLELSLASVYFSSYELELREWLSGRKDISWRILTDSDNGVLSKRFVRAFNEDLAEEAQQYLGIADRVYRECSEFVHGNALTHDRLPDKLEFVESAFNDWHEKARSSCLVVSFALGARYLKVIKREDLMALEQVVTDGLGHITAIRALFGASPEVQ